MSLPLDPEWDHLADLRPADFEVAKSQILDEAQAVAHLDGTAIIGRLLALIRAMDDRGR